MKLTIKICLIALLSSLYSGHSLAKTFKIATLAPAGTTWMKLMKQGARNINEKTDGRVRLKFYPGGVMGNEQSVHRKIKVGQLHGGAFTSSGLENIYPGIQALSLPMVFGSLDEVDYVRSKIDQSLKQNMEQGGFVLLGIANGGFAKIMSQQPLTDLEAIRSSKVWIPEGDNVVLETFKSLGISPISLSIADVFTGLQTGLIETVTVTPTAAIAFQWHTSTSYMTVTPLGYLIGILAVQKKAFDGLSPEDQIIVRDEMQRVFSRLDKLNRSDNQAAQAALQQQGIEFVSPSPEELARWKSLSATSIDKMVKSGAISSEIVDQVKVHLESFQKSQ